jgi:aquaporin Z
MDLRRKLAVEFIGTFFLVFTVGMASKTAGSFAPLAIGAVLMVMVFAGGHVSGAHYNPAVSTAVLLRGKMPRSDYVPYVATQIVAGIVAAIVVIVLGYNPSTSIRTGGIGSMLVVEFLFTFALAYVVLNVATARDTEGNSFYGLAIGFTLATGIFAVGPISGGAFNPAVAVGATLMGVFSWSHIWIYVLASLVGGAAAAEAFRLIEPAEQPSGLRAAHPDDLRVGSREAA